MDDDSGAWRGRAVGRGGLSPLWIISLFLSLTETVLGVGVFRTKGGIQVALTAFVIVFPVLIAIAFFAILWKRAIVLYRPADFGSDVDPQSFADALRDRGADQADLYETIENVVHATFASQQTISEVLSTVSSGSEDAREDLEETLVAAAIRTVESIKETGFVTIDAFAVPGAAVDEVWEVPFEGHKTVANFLDDVWLRLRRLVLIPPFTYGTEWVLIDPKTDEPFVDIGRTWARARGLLEDARPLVAIGIEAGMVIRLELPGNQPPVSSPRP